MQRPCPGGWDGLAHPWIADQPGLERTHRTRPENGSAQGEFGVGWHGFLFETAALLRRLATIALLLAPCAARADLFSPGELARPHEKLEGVSNCTQCHPAGQQLSPQLCLGCHKELEPEIAGGRGFHGRIKSAERECEQCHHEHQGREFKLVDWGPGGMKSFQHAKTGWPLVGKHAGVECATCHEARRVKEPAILALMKRYPDMKTMLGVPKACETCHFDEHRGQLKAKCESCHKETGWKPAPGFNHAATNYPLKGKHAAVACNKCHEPEADKVTSSDVFPKPVVAASFVRYAPVAHASCLECHADPHSGQFGHRCENCHSVEGWLVIRNGPSERNFHDKTQFPLRGAHTTVDCKACHGPFKDEPARFKGVAFAACADCHADAHEGQLKKLSGEKPPGCDRCHTVEDFIPTTFEVADHAKTAYPLEGAHVAVPCRDCHAPEPKLASRIPAAVKSLLEARHRPAAFSLARFTFAGATGGCEGCHEDPHGGQFGKGAAAKRCTTCHKVSGWSDLAFDHDRDSRFALTGRHKGVACGECHATDVARGQKHVHYKPLETGCASCHTDAHAGQLADATTHLTACETCHATSGWKPAPTFVHAPPFTDFVLEGEHMKVACPACHLGVDVGKGVKVTRYKPLPRQCEDCHADFHKGAFSGFQP